MRILSSFLHLGKQFYLAYGPLSITAPSCLTLHLSPTGPWASIMMTPHPLSRGTHDVTQAGPPGCCFLLATMIRSWMNTGPTARQSEPKRLLLEHLGKRTLCREPPHGDSLPVSEADRRQQNYDRGEKTSPEDTTGAPGSSHA